MRLEQSVPGMQILDFKTYNYLLTGHSVGMLFWKGLTSGEKAPENPWKSPSLSLKWKVGVPARAHGHGDHPPKVEPDWHPYRYDKEEILK